MKFVSFFSIVCFIALIGCTNERGINGIHQGFGGNLGPIAGYEDAGIGIKNPMPQPQLAVTGVPPRGLLAHPPAPPALTPEEVEAAKKQVHDAAAAALGLPPNGPFFHIVRGPSEIPPTPPGCTKRMVQSEGFTHVNIHCEGMGQ